MAMKKKWMRIRELASSAGVSRHTIHYYLKEDLLPPPVKTGKTMALYTDVHLDCLSLIRQLRESENTPIAIVRQEIRSRYGRHWSDAGEMKNKIPKGGSKGEEQRRRIIEKAIELFSSKGYHGTQISDIADSLGISKGTFYIYFEHKQDLLIYVFDQLIDYLTQSHERIVKDPDPISRLLERARAYHSFFLKYHKIIDIARAESIGQEKNGELNLQSSYRKILDHAAQDIRQAVEEGLIQDNRLDPELLSYMLLGSLDYAFFRMIMDDAYTFDDVLKTMFSMLMLGFQGRNLTMSKYFDGRTFP